MILYWLWMVQWNMPRQPAECREELWKIVTTDAKLLMAAMLNLEKVDTHFPWVTTTKHGRVPLR